jgi:hypothetical protein
MSEDKFICIPLYFTQPPVNGFLYKLWELIQFIMQKEKKDITYWEFSTAEKTKIRHGSSLNNGNAVFNRNIIKKYDGDIFYLAVLSMKNGTDILKHADVNITFSKFNELFKYGFVYLQILKEKQNLFDYALKMIKDCFSIVKIEYGLVCEMEKDKLPNAYFNELGSDKLSKEDRDNMLLWRKNKINFNTLIRELYIGNILTSKHLNNERKNLIVFEKEIKDLCVKTEWLNDDTLFFLDGKLASNEDGLRDKVKAMIIKHSGKFMEMVQA